jgi:Bacterial TSP3 repeat
VEWTEPNASAVHALVPLGATMKNFAFSPFAFLIAASAVTACTIEIPKDFGKVKVVYAEGSSDDEDPVEGEGEPGGEGEGEAQCRTDEDCVFETEDAVIRGICVEGQCLDALQVQDSDGDGFSDSDEINAGSDPFAACSTLREACAYEDPSDTVEGEVINGGQCHFIVVDTCEETECQLPGQVYICENGEVAEFDFEACELFCPTEEVAEG